MPLDPGAAAAAVSCTSNRKPPKPVLRAHPLFAPNAQVTLVNRLLRLLTVVVATCGMDPENFQRFLDNTTFGYTGSLPVRPYVSLLRFVVGVPLFWSVHANFVLPFAYVLAAQVITAAASCYGLRASVCVMLSSPGVAQAAAPLCQVSGAGVLL
jgi:hypothetical protein